MDANDLHALSYLAQLQRLTPADSTENAVRITLRNAAGEYIGEAPLPADAVKSLTDATEVIADYRQANPLIPYTLTNGTEGTAPELDIPDVPVDSELDPELVADLEDHFAAIDPNSYLNDVFSAEHPEAAAAAYEQLVTGEWDGDL
ncbi:hypothetical protein [Streptomyces sp. NRRL F-5135]|uniref:hypothetical protein n=1 Tax=Streptomyces sp. NRRL F-5135 TaxID=1463858 RepID=UPI0004CADD4A|nr:hypothetical protein [Streptomyces sp. NRRL F-5135]